MIPKTQNMHMYSCLRHGSRDLFKLRALMMSYLDKNKDKDTWTHWVNRLVQFKVLESFTDLIPIDQPELPLPLYTSCLVYLMRCQQFARYLELLRRMPDNLVNFDVLTKKLTSYLDENKIHKQLAEDQEVLEIYFKLYQIGKKPELAF